MKNNLLGVAIFLLVLIPLFTWAEEMERFTSEESRFSLDYPKNWQVKKEGLEYLFTSHPDFEDANRDEGVGFGIALMPSLMSEDLDLKKMWDKVTEEQGTLLGPDPIEVPGATGLWGVLEAEGDVRFEAGIFQAGDRVFMVVTAMHPASTLEAEYKPVLDAMRDSLEFLPVPKN